MSRIFESVNLGDPHIEFSSKAELVWCPLNLNPDMLSIPGMIRDNKTTVFKFWEYLFDLP
jgi:hypothetical protein